jgi:hypothetical protein
MSQTEAGILIVVVLGLVAIFAFLRYGRRARVKIKGPGNTGLDLDASDDPQAAIRAEDVKSRKGGITATDETGWASTPKRLKSRRTLSSRWNVPAQKSSPGTARGRRLGAGRGGIS